MGDGNSIIIIIGAPQLNLSDSQGETESTVPDNRPSHYHPKSNGSNLYNRQWQRFSASDLRSTLLSTLAGRQQSGGQQTPGSTNTTQPPTNLPIDRHGQQTTEASNRTSQTNQTSQSNQSGQTSQSNQSSQSGQSNSINQQPLDGAHNTINQTLDELPNTINQTLDKTTNFTNSTLDETTNFTNRTFNETTNLANKTFDKTTNPASQTFDDVINTAKGHDSFTEFKNQPKEFWDQVRQMSDVRIVEKYVDGGFESRAVSRYGELLDKFTRQGGQANTFLGSLPPQEREVFQARHLLNQTLGIDELYIGKGIVIDKNGQFAVRDFLLNNGKQIDMPLNTLMSMLGGKGSENFAQSLFTNAQLLLNPKTAALLSLSLALYQNVNSTLPLTEAMPQVIPQNYLGKTNENGGMRLVENNLDKAKVNVERKSGETLIAAALINGALIVIDERGQTSTIDVDEWTTGKQTFGNVFSAGATGAMLGAIIGCVVPLSETNIGTALGFAASVVVGTSERGLRSLSVSLLISDVVTSGVQTFLSAAPTMLLEEKPAAEDLLKQQLSNFRTLAYLGS